MKHEYSQTRREQAFYAKHSSPPEPRGHPGVTVLFILLPWMILFGLGVWYYG